MKNYVLLALIFNLTFVQDLLGQNVVKGTVYDESDKSPLPGVNVVLEGTTAGVVTDFDGNYEIDVPSENSVLIFSFIGMETQKVEVKGRVKIDVFLSETDNALDEVVLTALGIKREEKALGYSVQEVKGEDAIANGNPNPISGLQGKVAGIQVTQSSGTPGSSSKIIIRGNATFGNNQPLIVIDGVPMDNSTNSSYSSNVGGVDQSNRAIDINPDDIESVSVLKGAAATALYGSRAGNGVIIYTTKKGNQNSDSPQMSGTFSSDITLTRPVNLHQKQESYGQSTSNYSNIGINNILNYEWYNIINYLNQSSIPSVFNGSPSSWGNKIEKHERVDALGDFLQTGISQNYNLALSGGNTNSSTRFSVGYTNSKGIIPNSTWDRLSTRLTSSAQLTSKLKVSGTANLINSGGNRPQKGSNITGVMLSLYRNPINYDPYKAYFVNSDTKGKNHNYFNAYDNPYFSAEKNTYKDDVWRILGNVSFNYNLLGDRLKNHLTTLSLVYRSGIDSYSDTRKEQSPIGSNSTIDKKGIIGDYKQTFFEWNNDYILSGGKTLNDRFNLSFILGANSRALKDEYVYNRGTTLTEEDFYNILNAQSVVPEQYTLLINEYAAYTDLTFSFDNMFYLGLSARNEWSSNYNKENNSNLYPAANMSFVFSELFNQNKSLPQALTFGKIRASIGKTGIAPKPWRYKDYTTTVSVGVGFTEGNNSDVQSALLTNYNRVRANPNLGPEIQVGKELGFDLRFWDERLTIDCGIYQQNISDILIEVPVSSATGFMFEYQNIGKMRNRGIELSIGSLILQNKNINWSANFNFGLNKNEVLDLELTDSNDDRVNLPGGFVTINANAAEGEAFGSLFGTKWKTDKFGNMLVDDHGFYIESEDQVKIADPNPDFTMGLKNTFTYKNWSINLFFDGFFGGDIYNGTKAMMNSLGIGVDTEDREGTIILNGVHEDGTINTTEISKQDYWLFVGGISGAASAQIERNINYVKLRELGVTYHLNLKPESPLSRLAFSVTGTNLLTFTNYSDGDPETSLTGAGSNTSGFDYFNSPNTRGIVFKVSANF